MKKFVSLFLVGSLMCFCGCVQKYGNSLMVNVAENKEVTIEKGRELVISLKANPTTGYSWSLVKQGDVKNRIIELSAKPRYEPESNRIGSGGQMKYFFKTIGRGDVKLVFKYARPWVKDMLPAEEYTVSVSVK